MNSKTSSPPQDLWKDLYKVSKQIMRKINANFLFGKNRKKYCNIYFGSQQD